MTAIVLRLLVALLVLFILPLVTHAAWWAMRDDLAPDWASADWSSAKLLPAPAAHEAAIVRIYAARTGRWKGVVAHHSWIVVKGAGALRYTRYDKVGWGSPVRTDAWPADARWFGNVPQLVLAIDGADVARVQQTQLEHSERLTRVERRLDEDVRMKGIWGSNSPFPSVLSGGTPQQGEYQLWWSYVCCMLTDSSTTPTAGYFSQLR